MELNPNEKRLLRNLFQGGAWTVIEKLLAKYKDNHFFTASAYRKTEFETMWNVAYNEGGKEHLEQFFADLENVAKDE